MQDYIAPQWIMDRVPAAPERVAARLDRLGREVRYLAELLDIEGRGDEWREVARHLGPVADMMEAGGFDRAAAAVPEVEAALQPWASLAKSLIIHYVGHAHMDMNWLWDWPETVQMVVDTLTTVDHLMDEFPAFRFSQSQTAVYEIVRRFAPGLFDRIAERVRQGRWEITANQWVEGDKNLASDESIVRHLLYSKQFFARHWGIDFNQVKVDFEPDTFGHPGGLPTLYRDAGVRWLYFCRGGPGHTAFRWQAPDGSEVLAWSDFQEWYNGTITGDEVQSALKACQETGLRSYLKVYGVGDHGGGPTRKDLNRLMQMMEWPLFPTLKPAHLADHFEALEADKERLPIVSGELNYVFPGCYSSESEVKTLNAEDEAALRTAEGLQAMARLLAVSLPPSRVSLQEAWEETLFQQFHDILSGSGIPATYRYALGRGQEAAAAARMAARQAMAAMAEAINTQDLAEDALPIVVFNPLAWDREDVVEVDVYERYAPGSRLRLADNQGQPVAVQFHYDSHLGFPGHRRARVTFSAKVPGLGYAVYILAAGTQSLPAESADIVGETVAEGHQTVSLAGRTVAELGLVSHINAWRVTDLPRELRLFFQLGLSAYQQGYRLKTPAYQLQARAGQAGLELLPNGGPTLAGVAAIEWFREEPRGMTAWEIGADVERHPVVGVRWTMREMGAVRAVLRGEMEVAASKVAMTVTCYPNHRRLDLLLDVDWRELGSPTRGIPGLAIRFPWPANMESSAHFGQSAGSTTRPIPTRDVPSQGWTAVSGAAGTALVLHPTRYGVSVADGAISVTLLRASYDPDPYPEVGRHLIPLSFEWTDMEMAPDLLTRRAFERMSRLQGWVSDSHAGRLLASAGTLRLLSTSGLVTAVKPAEDGHRVTARMRHDGDQPVGLELALAASPAAAQRVNLLEIAVDAPLASDGKRITVPVVGHGMATVAIEP